MAYNSYVIIDEKIAVMDTVDARFRHEWLDNLADALDGRKPDYLIVQHMEPDHSANVMSFVAAYPEVKVVASAKAFAMMGQFFGDDLSERQIVISEGSTLELGKHTLNFIAAPWFIGRRLWLLMIRTTRCFSPPTVSESSAHSTLMRTGLARQDAIISALSESTAFRFRSSCRKRAHLTSKNLSASRSDPYGKSRILSRTV